MNVKAVPSSAGTEERIDEARVVEGGPPGADGGGGVRMGPGWCQDGARLVSGWGEAWECRARASRPPHPARRIAEEAEHERQQDDEERRDEDETRCGELSHVGLEWGIVRRAQAGQGLTAATCDG